VNWFSLVRDERPTPLFVLLSGSLLGIDRRVALAMCVAGAALVACSGDAFVSAARVDGGPGKGGTASGGSAGSGGRSSGGASAGGRSAGGSSSGGTPTTGGALGAGGASGNGGSGGAAGASSGTVNLVLEIAGSTTYCDNIDGGCGVPLGVTHITIADAARRPISTSSFLCGVECSTCIMLPCPGAPGGPSGCGFSQPFSGTTVAWDGSYTATSICGANVACYEKRYAPPGQYTATMCATPGHMALTDAGEDVCINTGPVECVEVPFDYPGSGTVKGTLGN
jgi:hypothetical protein